VQWDEVVRMIRSSARIIVLSEKEAHRGLKEVLSDMHSGTISLVVGPEGGLEASEVADVQQAGGYAVSLGSRILRTETAAIVGAALIQHETGGF
jgi:16S rRNA (uracil1498-N3)-methyltransferase